MTESNHPAVEMEDRRDAGDSSWAELVEKIRAGDESGMEDLYRVFSEGIRFHLCRQLGPQDLDDKIHDIFVIIAQSIRKGELRQPERLMGYVRTIVRRQLAAYVNGVIEARRRETVLDPGMSLSDHHPDPERRAIERQNAEVAMRVLKSIPQRDREVLVRFYLKEQTAPEICGDMGLTENQFRLIKSRAKARFGNLGRSRLSRRFGFLRSE